MNGTLFWLMTSKSTGSSLEHFAFAYEPIHRNIDDRRASIVSGYNGSVYGDIHDSPSPANVSSHSCVASGISISIEAIHHHFIILMDTY